MAKVVGQTPDGGTALVDLGGGQAQVVSVKQRVAYRSGPMGRILRRFVWIPFKGNEADILAIVEEKARKVS